MDTSEIDWDRCFEDLGKKIPAVDEDLRRRLGPLLKTSLINRFELGPGSVKKYPPHVTIFLPSPKWVGGDGTSPVEVAEYDRMEDKIMTILGEVASAHGLRIYAGYYREKLNPTPGRRMKFWVNQRGMYTFKPDYQAYRKEQTQNTS